MLYFFKVMMYNYCIKHPAPKRTAMRGLKQNSRLKSDMENTKFNQNDLNGFLTIERIDNEYTLVVQRSKQYRLNQYSKGKRRTAKNTYSVMEPVANSGHLRITLSKCQCFELINQHIPHFLDRVFSYNKWVDEQGKKRILITLNRR